MPTKAQRTRLEAVERRRQPAPRIVVVIGGDEPRRPGEIVIGSPPPRPGDVVLQVHYEQAPVKNPQTADVVDAALW